MACQEQHTDIAKLLVSRGSSTSVLDATGCSPLRLAVNNGNVPLMHFFLERSVDGLEVKVKGLSLVDLASVRKFSDAVFTLAKFGAKLSDRAVKMSIAEGNTNLLKACADQGLPLQKDALHLACRKGDLDLCRMLVEKLGLAPDDKCVVLAKNSGNDQLEAWIRPLVVSGCAACGKAAEKRCGKCKLAKYCSVECQKKDFKSHSLVCQKSE